MRYVTFQRDVPIDVCVATFVYGHERMKEQRKKVESIITPRLVANITNSTNRMSIDNNNGEMH